MKFLNKLFGRSTAEAPVAPVEETVESVAEAEPEPVIFDYTDTEVAPEVIEDEAPTEHISASIDEAASADRVETAQDPESLSLALRENPTGAELHAAVVAVVSDPVERVEFYQRLVDSDAAVPYHSLSLGRTLRGSGRIRESVGHFQLYLRSTTEASVLEELAEVFDELGDAYMASSSRMVAESLRKQG